jgi:NADH-quinone oxidoreductase subunit M
MTISFDFNKSGFQFVESREWIPAFGIKYALGVDGIALVLILMIIIQIAIVGVVIVINLGKLDFGIKIIQLKLLH